MAFKLSGSFVTYHDPSGNPLIALNRDGSVSLTQIDFSDGTTQSTAGTTAGAVSLTPSADQTISGAHTLILSDAGSSLYVGSASPFGGFGDSAQLFVGPSESSLPAALQGFLGSTTAELTNTASGTTLGLLGTGAGTFNFESVLIGSNGVNARFDTTNTGVVEEWGLFVSIGSDGVGGTGTNYGMSVNAAEPTNGALPDNVRGIEINDMELGGGLGEHVALVIQNQTGVGVNDYAIKVLGGRNNLGPQVTTVGSLIVTDAGGGIKLPGSSSGTATIVAPAAAGTPTLTLPTVTSTIANIVAAPGTASSTGVANSIAYDATHIYVCVATNTWVRATLATF